jgi:hypothetical protein
MRSVGALGSGALSGCGSARLGGALVGSRGGLGFGSGGEGVGDAGLSVASSAGVMLAQHVCGGFPKPCHGYVGNFRWR